MIGPPAAAANSSVAAGALPAPSSSSSATSGISNSSGTLISTPSVAATAMPATLSPRKASTVSGCRNWRAAPLSIPATTMIGPMRTTRRPVACPQRQSPSRNSPAQPPSGSVAAGGVRSQTSGSGERPATRATNGPSRKAAVSPSSTRLAPSSGENTTAIISSDGTLRVAEPCTSARAPSIPSPRRRTALDTGTMHAEQRFTTGPRPSPLRMRPTGPVAFRRETVRRCQERLGDAAGQERECHAGGDELQVGEREAPPASQEARLRLRLHAEAREALRRGRQRRLQVGAHGVELGQPVERCEGEQDGQQQDRSDHAALAGRRAEGGADAADHRHPPRAGHPPDGRHGRELAPHGLRA